MTGEGFAALSDRLAAAERYITAIEAVEHGVVGFDVHQQQIDELRAAKDAWHTQSGGRRQASGAQSPALDAFERGVRHGDQLLTPDLPSGDDRIDLAYARGYVTGVRAMRARKAAGKAGVRRVGLRR